MGLFDDSNVRLNVLKQRAYNYRWAEVDDGVIPLTAADPDFPVAEPVRQAMIDYINGGYFSYTPKLGLPEFKLALVSGGEKFFGQGSEGYIRICFATSRGLLEEGLNRLEKGIRMLMEEKGLH